VERLSRVEDFVPGQLVQWDWVPNGFGQSAIEKGIRPLGKIVDKSDFPNMACDVGIEVIDAPNWVISPEFALSKGREFFKVSIDQ